MKILSFVISGCVALATGIASAASPVSAGSYCLALRGNGELAPAHWGALAQVVEKKGLPDAMAGGSSASTSLFLLESIALNPTVVGKSRLEQRKAASLLLKSLQAYLESVIARPEWQDMAQLATHFSSSDVRKMEFATLVKAIVEGDPQALADLDIEERLRILKSLEDARDVGVVDFQALSPLYDAVMAYKSTASPADRAEALAKIRFLSGEIYSSITMLGKFNAETDHNIFFRPGVISFRELAASLGRIASFYAGRSMSAQSLQNLQDFVAQCEPLSRGKTWDELRRVQPKCDSDFKKLVSDYHEAKLPKFTQDRVHDGVGRVIPAFPTTAVLRDSAYLAAQKALRDYATAMNPEFGKSFSVNPDDVSFGYWGPEIYLQKIERNLAKPFFDGSGRPWDFTQDAKSRRFQNLGDATWEQVLSTSPAEPGLAQLQEFRTKRGTFYSAGGWSDLHPAAVLKAAGCENIVYVTRRGGESLFGQGVAKRLLGFDDIPWSVLATDPARKPANKIRNNNGDPGDMTSQWSQLYNLANPDSSFSRSLEMFDSVVCADWDRFDITKSGAISAMIAEAYRAPVVSRKTAKPQDYGVDPQLGFRPYAGCLPQR